MNPLADYIESASNAPSFDEVRQLRAKAATLDAQRLLALQDRRAFAREYVQDNPLTGPIAIGLLSPAEQVYKGVNHLAGRQIGRSGFFSPLANIGAAYQGVLEGIAAKGENLGDYISARKK